MIRAMVGRGLLIIAFCFSIISPAVPVFGYLVAAMVAVGFLCICSAEKHVWHDGWHAAHDHHKIEGGHGHLNDYTEQLRRQP